MTEGIYILTMLYAVYVVDDIEGVRIVVYIRDNLHLDLVSLHQKYRQLRDSISGVIASAIPINISSAA